jgi:hypothetical protein
VWETYPLIAREKHKFGVYENRVWREDLDERGKKIKNPRENMIKTFIICTPD